MHTVTEAAHLFLQAQASSNPNLGMAARWTPHLETQINVSPAQGQPVEGHAAGVGVDDAAFERIKDKAQNLPYVEVTTKCGRTPQRYSPSTQRVLKQRKQDFLVAGFVVDLGERTKKGRTVNVRRSVTNNEQSA